MIPIPVITRITSEAGGILIMTACPISPWRKAGYNENNVVYILHHNPDHSFEIMTEEAGLGSLNTDLSSHS